MPKPSRGSEPDALARDVDRLLAQLSGGAREAPASSSPSGKQRRITRVSSSPSSSFPRAARLGLWARVLLAVVFGVALTQWPYGRECGSSLAAYLSAVTMVVLAAAWVAVASWKLRDGVAHVLGVLLLLWGVALAAERVLPRIGYAAQQGSWRCTGSSGIPVLPFGVASR